MYKKLPVFQKTGSSAYKPGLDRIKKLLISLKNPEKNFKSIHIAGTNGKGTTLALIEDLIIIRGLKTGAYTSPHLIEYNERITVNKANVADQDLIDSFEHIESCLLYTSPSPRDS